MKFLLWGVFSLFFVGCTTEVTRDVSDYEQKIKSSERSVRSSLSFLNSNSDVYVNSECVLPSRGPAPDPFYTTREESKKNAIAYCAGPLGCSALGMMASDELDTFSKRFLASEACSELVRRKRGENYNADDTTLNMLEAGLETKQADGGFFGFLAGVASVSMKLQKIAKYKACVSNRTDKHYNRYIEWRDRPSELKDKCERHVRNIKQEKRKINLYRERVEELKKSFSWKVFGTD